VNRLELASLILGVIFWTAGIWETTKQALGEAIPEELSLRRWLLVYSLALLPFVGIGLPLVLFGAGAVV